MTNESNAANTQNAAAQLGSPMNNFLNPEQLQSLSANYLSPGNAYTNGAKTLNLVDNGAAASQTECVWFSKKQIDKLFADNCGSEPADQFGLKVYFIAHDKEKDPLPGLPAEHQHYDKLRSAALVMTKIKDGWNEELIDNEAYDNAAFKAKAIYAAKLCPPEICRVREEFNI